MSDIRPGLIAPFSYPGIRADEALFAEIAGFSARASIEAALALSEAHGGDAGLRDAARRWLGARRPLRRDWSATVSKAGRYAREGDAAGNDDRLARLLLDSDAPDVSGLMGFARQAVPVLAGNRLLRAGDRGIESEGKPIQRVRDIRIVETDQSAEAVCGDCAVWLPIAMDAVRPAGRHQVIAEALDLLDEIAPDHATWVNRILNLIVMIPGMENRTCSGSWADAAGTIYCSEPSSALEAAEVLVHECSHQYFHMLELLGSTRNEDERGAYYSPAVQRERPLDRILIAYHAFANVLTLYELAFDRGLGGDQRTLNRYTAFADDVAVLQGHLDGSSGLSALGRAVYAPLRALREEAPVEPLGVLEEVAA